MMNVGLPLKEVRHFSQSTHERVDQVIDYFRLENYELAVEMLDEVLAKEEKNYLALYQKGVALMGLGRYVPAITCFDTILEWSNDIYTLLAKGEALHKSESEIAALECFDKAIKFARDKIKQIEDGVIVSQESFTDQLALAHAYSGYIWQELGDFSESKQHYLKAIELNSSEVGYFKLRYAKCCFDAGENYETTRDAYNVAIQAQPSPEAYLSRVEFFVTHGKYTEALSDIEYLLGTEITEPTLWWNRQIYKGLIHWYLGDFDQAVAEFNKTEESELFNFMPAQTQALLYHNRARAFLSLNKKVEATEDAKKAAALDAENTAHAELLKELTL